MHIEIDGTQKEIAEITNFLLTLAEKNLQPIHLDAKEAAEVLRGTIDAPLNFK